MIRWLLSGALLVVLALGIAVGFFNSQAVTFHYLVGTIELPLIGLLVAELFLVALLTIAVCGGRILMLRGEVRKLKRNLRDAESELKTLRNLAVKDSA